MLDAGTYRGKPIRTALGLTGTGKEQIAIEFEFTDPPGTRRTWYGFFTDNTFDRTIEALRACGWQGTDLSDFAMDEVPVGFDQEVELVVQVEEYPEGSGKFRDKIAFVNSGGGLALKTAMTQDQARAFAERLKGRIIATDQAAQRTTAMSGKPAAKPAQRQQAAQRPKGGTPARSYPPQEVIDSQAPENEDVPF